MRQQRSFSQRPFTKQRFSNTSNASRDVIRAIKSHQQTTAALIPENQSVFIPQHTFADFSLPEALLRNITYKNYTELTPIQDEAIEPIQKGKDIIGIANTGAGKTAAFLIPLIDKASKMRSEKVLIIAPTRELAVQISDELHSLGRGLGITSVLCIGGANLQRQKMTLSQHPQFVIGTPGRLKELIQERVLHLSQFRTVVLDEADRMVDIGFIQDIKYFISLLPKTRQSLFFSATISGKVHEILRDFVYNPVTVSVKIHEIPHTISEELIKVVHKDRKVDQLHDLLVSRGFDKVLIFGRTKWGIQKLTDELVRRGFKAGAIHGNKRQNQRQKTLDQFKRNDIRILLATDVASRGLDISGVTHVINYDVPASFEDYIHRIGRTGRANNIGVALTFFE